MSRPKYWRGIEELEQTPEFLANASREFPTDMSIEKVMAEVSDESLEQQASRRDFLKILGFGMSAAALAACAEGPVKKAIPYVNKPDDIIPGVANWYASTAPNGAPVLVRAREGRPIKLEGNPDSPLTKGGLSALAQASLLSLYDIERLQTPSKGGNTASWEDVDREISQKIDQIIAAGGAFRVVSGTVLSPSVQQAINELLARFADGKHVTYDPASVSALRTAHAQAFGKNALPTYHFDKAMTIVSFDCDFLGSWVAPEVYSAAYVVNRDPKKPMSRHLQIEPLMSLTGAKADLRFPVDAHNMGAALINLYNKIAKAKGRPELRAPQFDVAMSGLDIAAKDLLAAGNKGLVVCGTNDVAAQLIVAAINNMLGSYGTTLDIDNPSYFAQGNDEDMAAFVADLKAGKIGGVVFYDANPLYNTPYAADITQALSKVTLSVSLSPKADETAKACQYVCPDSHYLESWGDARVAATHVSVIQPTINPIFNTRQAGQSFLRWAGKNEKFVDYVKAYWQTNVLAGAADFRGAWMEALRKGIVTLPAAAASASFTEPDLQDSASKLMASFSLDATETFDIVFYQKVSIRDGKSANNPWLQELPDPVSKCTWDNYVTVPVTWAKEKGVQNGDVLAVKIGESTLYMPAMIQVGQARNTLGIALGFGSQGGKVCAQANGELKNGRQVAGANVYPFVSFVNGALSYTASRVSVSQTGDTYTLALTQTFNTMYDPAKGVQFGADFDRTERIIEATTTYEYNNGGYAKHVAERDETRKHLVTLWDTHYKDPETKRLIHWKMAVDLNKCTGCGACVVACQAENNIPVVGKKEVARRREMHWMRIDRYYSGDSENPDVVFQPMMCQHCDNAPCETVCPVLATIHSNEGLNQMTYSRCVGTRYCANNCPYKVRRFNWFNYFNDAPLFGDYYTHHELGRLVLNPDVTVRFRGVMEKCTFCVQRLQEGKLRAKVTAGTSLNSDGSAVKPEDGSIKTACQQSCPTGAIVFGDFNDEKSEVSRLFREDRSYVVLEDVKAQPNVQYLALVRNRSEAEGKEKEQARIKEQTYTKG
ncbi:MAG: TAT-variant-translocated molybdopterin oxidoreductase [Bacteroidia bacterium]|nr:TAT-variant-translocated molybdopterin oxidoreductase [Bacteroidia bacterium]